MPRTQDAPRTASINLSASQDPAHAGRGLSSATARTCKIPTSLVTQKRRIEEYAERKGWIIVGWYEEPEQSAKYDEIEQRPIFAQMLDDAGGRVRSLLCYINNRWARNVGVAFNSLAISARSACGGRRRMGVGHGSDQQDGVDVCVCGRDPDQRRLCAQALQARDRRQRRSRTGGLPQWEDLVWLSAARVQKGPRWRSLHLAATTYASHAGSGELPGARAHR